MELLRVLDLSNNRHLASLPGSLLSAKRLEEVNVYSCEALEDMKAVGSAKLRSFDFFNNDGLMILPDPLCGALLEEIRLEDCRGLKGIDEIGGCARLRIFFLKSIINLESLPPSFSKLHNLEKLYIIECEALDSIDLCAYDPYKLRVLSLVTNFSIRSLPQWIRSAKALEELYLEDCRALEEIEMEGDCTNIRSFSLSRSPIVELSLTSCRDLETVSLVDLPELEVLDLSFTRISELSTEIFRLPKLRRFNMLVARHLRRFPWHAVPRLPKEFNFDNCISNDVRTSQCSSCVSVDDPRFFCSLTAEASERLLGKVQHPSQFHVRISPGEKARDRSYQRSSITEAAAAAAGYSHIMIARENFLNKDAYRRPNHEVCRRLTMEGIDEFPYRPFPLLDSIDSLSVSDDRSLDTLAGLSPMGSLRECELTRCHNMEYAFEAEKTGQQELLSVLRLSGLEKLTVLCRSRGLRSVEPAGGFRSLQHLHLDHCWRLESVFPASFDLPSLETLTVKFCNSLREIFFGGGGATGNNVLPKLRSVCLRELPKLVHFCGGREVVAPALKELNVRGCWGLYRLPLISTAAAADAAAANHDQQVEAVADVGGEQEWWNRLMWDHYCIDGSVENRHIRFKARPRFATWEPTVRGRSRRSITKR